MPRAILGVAKRDVPAVLARALAMYNAMLANAAMFASPPIQLVAFLALVTALSAAHQNATETRARGTTALRNTKRDALWSAMEVLLKYVQSMADGLSVEGASSLIQAAGLVVARIGAHHKAVLTAALTSTPGLVHLAANASVLVGAADMNKKAFFNWQWSLDGGKSWNTMPSTPYASTELPGLTPLTTYSFRVSVTIGRTTGAWSDAISILVH